MFIDIIVSFRVNMLLDWIGTGIVVGLLVAMIVPTMSESIINQKSTNDSNCTSFDVDNAEYSLMDVASV